MTLRRIDHLLYVHAVVWGICAGTFVWTAYKLDESRAENARLVAECKR